jgi:hypothetical protein
MVRNLERAWFNKDVFLAWIVFQLGGIFPAGYVTSRLGLA